MMRAEYIFPSQLRPACSQSLDQASQSLMTPSSSPENKEQPFDLRDVKAGGSEGEVMYTEKQDQGSDILAKALDYAEPTVGASRKRKHISSGLDDDRYTQIIQPRKRVRTASEGKNYG